VQPRPQLVTGPVPPLVRRLAIPAATGYFFNTLYNVVDSVYAGLWSTAALAALGASFPVFFVIIATMAGLGQGTTGLIARALGAEDQGRARALADTSLALALGLGLAATALGLALAVPALAVMGLDAEARAYAFDYLVPIMLAAPLFLANAVVNARLAAQGDTRSYRNALVVGAFANVALNPLFMFGLGLGVAGIAWATALIQALTLAYLRHRAGRDELAAVTPSAAERVGLVAALARQSLPAMGNMTLIGVSLFTITAFVARHGDAAVAAYSAALRIEQLFLLPTVGLSAAGLTLIGNAYGAERYERIAATLKTTTLYGLAVMGLGTLVILLFREPLMMVFSRDPAVLDVGVHYLGVAALIQCAYVFNMMGNATLQGIGQPAWSFAVALGRSLVGPVVVLTLVEVVLELGLGAVFWSLFAINWTSAAVMVWLVRHRLRADCGLELVAATRVGGSSGGGGRV
jgi:putative MATE family efflux protein